MHFDYQPVGMYICLLSLTDSVGEKAFEVTSVLADTGARARVWLQVLDRHDGSYIVRFKLYESYKDIIISVLHNEKHVAKSPYFLKGRSTVFFRL